MNCEKIRELLLTDYLDDQLDEANKSVINQHLVQCQACAVFADRVKKYTLEPFKANQRLDPPAHLWNQIKAAVEPEPSVPFGQILIDNLCRLISLPRSIFAVSSVLAVVLIAFVSVKSPRFFTHLENHQLASAYITEEIESTTSANGISFTGLDTNIEKYLL